MEILLFAKAKSSKNFYMDSPHSFCHCESNLAIRPHHAVILSGTQCSKVSTLAIREIKGESLTLCESVVDSLLEH